MCSGLEPALSTVTWTRVFSGDSRLELPGLEGSVGGEVTETGADLGKGWGSTDLLDTESRCSRWLSKGKSVRPQAQLTVTRYCWRRLISANCSSYRMRKGLATGGGMSPKYQNLTTIGNKDTM